METSECRWPVNGFYSIAVSELNTLNEVKLVDQTIKILDNSLITFFIYLSTNPQLHDPFSTSLSRKD